MALGLKMFVRLFWIKQEEESRKVLQELFTKKKNGKTETRRVLDNVRMPLTARKLHNSCTLCHCYERLAVLQDIFAIILLWASEDVEKRFKGTVYKLACENIRFSSLLAAGDVPRKVPSGEERGETDVFEGYLQVR